MRTARPYTLLLLFAAAPLALAACALEVDDVDGYSSAAGEDRDPNDCVGDFACYETCRDYWLQRDEPWCWNNICVRGNSCGGGGGGGGGGDDDNCNGDTARDNDTYKRCRDTWTKWTDAACWDEFCNGPNPHTGGGGGGGGDRTFDAAGTDTYPVARSCRRARIVVWGAGGGHGGGNTAAAAGGYSKGDFDLSGVASLLVVVGGPGGAGKADNSTTGFRGGAGGHPGRGGRGGDAGHQDNSGGGGGGYSGVFRGSEVHGNALIMAGGGAGSGGGFGRNAGAGGGESGIDGDAGGGSQDAGGSGGNTFEAGGPLQGGDGQGQTNGDGGGGGGGGYYGGGGGRGANSDAFGGGGGSGFISPDYVIPGTDVPRQGSRGNPPMTGSPYYGDDAGRPGFQGRVVIDCL